jgi:hypothetical protein
VLDRLLARPLLDLRRSCAVERHVEELLRDREEVMVRGDPELIDVGRAVAEDGVVQHTGELLHERLVQVHFRLLDVRDLDVRDRER